MPRTFYRTVTTNPPTRADFFSWKEQGKRAPRDSEGRRMWEGISVFETAEQARQVAKRYPAQGSFIAEIVIPDESEIQYERSGPREGHHTRWGDGEEMRGCVRSIQRV